jgi:hypothetical protein
MPPITSHSRSGILDRSTRPATIGWTTVATALATAISTPICALVSPCASRKTLTKLMTRQKAPQYEDWSAA